MLSIFLIRQGAINSLYFCLSENILISLSLLRNNFAGKKFVDWCVSQLYYFNPLSLVYTGFEKSDVILTFAF